MVMNNGLDHGTQYIYIYIYIYIYHPKLAGSHLIQLNVLPELNMLQKHTAVVYTSMDS